MTRTKKELKARIAEEKLDTPAYIFAVAQARSVLNCALCELEDHKALLRELRDELKRRAMTPEDIK